MYTVWQFKNGTGEKIWFIHRILQFNSYPLQCTPLPYLHTAVFVSSIVRSSATAHQPPGSSVAVPFLPSPLQLMENGFPSVHFSLWGAEKCHRVPNPWVWRMFKYWNAFIGKKLLDRKGVVSWGRIPTLFFQRFGHFFRKICRTVSLLIPTMSAIILNFRRWTLRTISLIFWMFWSVFEVEGWPGC